MSGEIMNTQKWHCEACRKRGEVTYREHSGVYEVIQLIAGDHRRVSPKCEQSVMELRVER